MRGPPQDIIEQLSQHQKTYFSSARTITKVSPIEGNLADQILVGLPFQTDFTSRLEPSHQLRAFTTIFYMVSCLQLLTSQLQSDSVTRKSYQDLKRPILAALHRSLASRTAPAWEDPFQALQHDIDEGMRVWFALSDVKRGSDVLNKEDYRSFWEQTCLEGRESQTLRRFSSSWFFDTAATFEYQTAYESRVGALWKTES
ncbi:hypothetical protein E8E13_006016 [Curvularia kusanoi]|uniref:Uncharacterized protein n=1 Tax=Curvularia kusanoi TaxID=90978 RepID=A0A9P4T8N3_CURKU|nr:hypothetical protein E8E13_006016 [Curvularia kusanoi]